MAPARQEKPDFAAFAGRWSLDRKVSDLRAKATGTLTGEARFTPEGAGRMVYEETGAMTYAGHTPVTATRRYIWQARGAGVDVFFEDGREFHRIDLGRSMPDDEHMCTPDLYHVSYDFTRWPLWQATWRVVGPRKDYRLVSTYQRLS